MQHRSLRDQSEWPKAELQQFLNKVVLEILSHGSYRLESKGKSSRIKAWTNQTASSPSLNCDKQGTKRASGCMLTAMDGRYVQLAVVTNPSEVAVTVKLHFQLKRCLR